MTVSRSDDFLLTAEELRPRGQKRRRLIISAISLLLLLATLLLLARPTRHAIKAWQARRHARQAYEFIATQKWNDAQKEATAAYQLAPNEPEAIRAVARFLSRVRQPQALEFWDRLARLQPLTRDDLRDEASVALALAETERATAAISSLMATESDDATTADWLLAAQLAAQRGAPNESAEALQHVFQDPAASPRDRLQAAVLELRVSAGGTDQDQKRQVEAWGRIEKLAEGKESAGLDALVLLAQRALASQRTEGTGQASEAAGASPGSKRKSTAIAVALEAHPFAMAPQKLLAVDLRIHASPNEKGTLVQAAVDRWKDSDVKSLVALATWLNGHGDYQRGLDTIPPERAVQDRDLFLQRLDALGALGRWQEIKQALNSESYPLDPMIARMYLARCNTQLGEKAAADNNWQRALDEAGSDPGKLIRSPSTRRKMAWPQSQPAPAMPPWRLLPGCAPRGRPNCG